MPIYSSKEFKKLTKWINSASKLDIVRRIMNAESRVWRIGEEKIEDYQGEMLEDETMRDFTNDVMERIERINESGDYG